MVSANRLLSKAARYNFSGEACLSDSPIYSIWKRDKALSANFKCLKALEAFSETHCLPSGFEFAPIDSDFD